MVYRKVLKEAKTMELEKEVAVAINKPKRMRNIINNEIGNTKPTMDNIEIKYGSLLLLVGWDKVPLYCGHFWPIVQAQMIDEDDCGAIGGMKIGRGNRSTRRKVGIKFICDRLGNC
jgi:hypothetical protein